MTVPSVSFVSLGCAKNLVDSEKMLGLLAEAGCAIVGDGGTAEVAVVNTCGFLGVSRDEALEVLGELAEQKRRGDVQRIVVAGCLVQRDGQRLIEDVPEIDALVGVNNRADIVRAVTETSKSQKVKKSKRRDTAGERTVFLGEYHPASWVDANRSDRARLRLTPKHYAYLRISEGCDQKCTFCTIPSIRGPMHSKTVDEIVAEAREMIADGVVELILIGQDTTSFGHDIGYAAGLAGLLRALNRLDDLSWIRLMYVYPSVLSDEILDAVAECDKVLSYIDIPLQHIDDGVLKAMYRRVTRQETEALLQRVRDRIPGVVVRTTFIAGFPGESEAAFETLRAFVRDFGFDAMGVFPYSSEPGTPADRMKDRIPTEVIESRMEALMETQQAVAFAKARGRVGQTLNVLIDDFGREGVCPARHAGQAPEVDSLVYVDGLECDPGGFATVRCVAAQEYDLIARPVGSSLPILRD
ncbi:MAG: 30S ribosomal protein S12 methylthiotransferase RimO [Phycisphaerae bacterium]